MSDFHTWAAQAPDRPALTLIDGNGNGNGKGKGKGSSLSYGELAAGVDRAAHWFVGIGLPAGAHIALCFENHPRLIELALAARKAGLYYTPVNTHLTAAEAAFIVRDCGAVLLIVSAAMQDQARAIVASGVYSGLRVLVADGQVGMAPFEQLNAALLAINDEAAAEVRLAMRPIGRDLMYSSGTTGRPKGIARALAPATERGRPDREVQAWQRAFGFDAHSVYLSCAPLYHAAPLRYILRTLDVGGHCVAMSRFDAEAALRTIEAWRITHSQWVPTMFVRLLRLPASVRARYDLSSHRVAVHAAAPCSVAVKLALMAWWGDIVHEYYAGSEGLGATSITPQEWRTHVGSVGRAMVGQIRIVGGGGGGDGDGDGDGEVLPAGEIGQVYFADGPRFAYLNDPDKTRAAYNAQGWASYGDMGHVDAEGYLYLSDRRTDLILSGGVNLYPQALEQVLAQHPAVDEVAVIGVPDDEMGEVAKAVIALRPGHAATAAMAQALLDFAAAHVSRQKLPLSIVFEAALPRLETGKLLRRVLKDRYRDQPAAGFAVRPG